MISVALSKRDFWGCGLSSEEGDFLGFLGLEDNMEFRLLGLSVSFVGLSLCGKKTFFSLFSGSFSRPRKGSMLNILWRIDDRC